MTKEQLQLKISELDKIDFDNQKEDKGSLLKIVGFSNKTDLQEADNENEEL